MKRLALILALAAVPPASAAAAAQPAPAATPASPSAAQIAALLSADLPREVHPGTLLVGAAAEGRTLILTIQAPAAEVERTTMEFIGAEFARGFCAGGGEAYFAAGNSLRVDPQIAGQPARRGLVVSACPPAQAAQ